VAYAIVADFLIQPGLPPGVQPQRDIAAPGGAVRASGGV